MTALPKKKKKILCSWQLEHISFLPLLYPWFLGKFTPQSSRHRYLSSEISSVDKGMELFKLRYQASADWAHSFTWELFRGKRSVLPFLSRIMHISCLIYKITDCLSIKLSFMSMYTYVSFVNQDPRIIHEFSQNGSLKVNCARWFLASKVCQWFNQLCIQMLEMLLRFNEPKCQPNFYKQS